MLYPNDLPKFEFEVIDKIKRNLCSKGFDKTKKYLFQRLQLTTINYIHSTELLSVHPYK